MPIEISPNNVQGFLDSYLSPEEIIVPDKQDSPIQQAIDNLTQPTKTEEVQGDNSVKLGEEVKKDLTKEELEASLNKGEDIKKVEEEKLLIKDVSKLSEALKEKNLLVPYDDGTLPSTEEELFDALTQSSQFNAQQIVQEEWKKQVESLPPSLLKLHDFASRGFTTAREFAEFTNAVAQSEQVAELDVKNPEHQEQIVLLHLMNTGLDDKSAREELADLKAQNKLEDKAARFFPALKKSYDEVVRMKDQEQAEIAENHLRYVQTNASNVKYFLEKETDYLPFKLDNRSDLQYKSDIFNLAGMPVDENEDGSPIFGWQKQIESLQYGTQDEYKKFMKVMAYLANDKKFEEGISKKVATTVKTNEFKKIAGSAGNSVNMLSTEQTQPVLGIKKKSETVLPKAAWGQ